MKIYLIFFIFICVVNCSSIKNKNDTKMDSNKDINFDTYVSLLTKVSKNTKYPDINNVP